MHDVFWEKAFFVRTLPKSILSRRFALVGPVLAFVVPSFGFVAPWRVTLLPLRAFAVPSVFAVPRVFASVCVRLLSIRPRRRRILRCNPWHAPERPKRWLRKRRGALPPREERSVLSGKCYKHLSQNGYGKKKTSNDRCSFLWPPMGSYREHDSECCPAEGFRTSHWDYNVSCQGTRPDHDSKKKTSR